MTDVCLVTNKYRPACQLIIQILNFCDNIPVGKQLENASKITTAIIWGYSIEIQLYDKCTRQLGISCLTGTLSASSQLEIDVVILLETYNCNPVGCAHSVHYDVQK